MRVLVSTPDFPPETGGIQLLLERLVQHTRHHHRVVTFAAPSAVGSVSEVDVIRAPPMPDHRTAVLALNLETLHQLRTWRPDAVICGHVVSAPAALVGQAHFNAPVLQYLYSDELRRRQGLTRLAVRRAAALVAISTHTRAQAIALGATVNRLHLVPPGVDLSAPTAPEADARRASRPTIVTVARMIDRYKGFDVVLRALPLVQARVPHVRWVVIGDGPLREPLEKTAAAWGLGQACLFPGAVSDASRDAWLARSDVFALPSRVISDLGGGEGFGIVYLEAGSHSLPCIAGLGGGGADAVEDGKTGLVVDPYDHVAVAEAILALLTDPSRAAEMGRAGRRRAEEHSWGRMAAAIDAIVESITSGGRQ